MTTILKFYQYKNVVDSVRDPIVEIDLENAQGLDKDIELGDQLGIKIENPDFTRIDVADGPPNHLSKSAGCRKGNPLCRL